MANLSNRRNDSLQIQKYKVGQSVEFAASDRRPKPLGSFTIVRVMPSERGVQQYRVKSAMDGHERMVLENELV